MSTRTASTHRTEPALRRAHALQGELALTCLLEASASECTANGTLSAARYLTDAYVAPTPDAPPTVVPVATSVRFASGEPAPLPGGAPPATQATGGSCDNALQEVVYTVLTSAPGVVDSVAADVVITNVPIDATGAVSVRRAFSVRFRAATSAVRTIVPMRAERLGLDAQHAARARSAAASVWAAAMPHRAPLPCSCGRSP